jgi:hypothetical protein
MTIKLKKLRLINGVICVGVVVKDRYGLGWSSEARSREDARLMLFDPALVDIVLAKDYPAFVEWMHKNLPEYVSYMDEKHFAGLGVDWIDEGERFFIRDYDGTETIMVESALKWEVA